MSTLDITEFGKSSANMKKCFIEKLKERFSTERTEDVQPSDLNAGIIGFSMDMMGSAIEDAWFNNNSKSKEIFVSSAKFDDSIYMHAVDYKINDFFATPASTSLILAVEVSEIIKNAVSVSDNSETYKKLTLSGSTQFILGDYYYLLDYPIDFIVKSKDDKEVISCKYNLTEINKFSDVNSTYIQSVNQIVSGKEYFLFKVRIHQLGKTSSQFIYSPKSNSVDIYEYSYESQLAGFIISYRENDNSSWEKINTNYFGDVKYIDSKTKFCYYRLLDDNRFQISFSSNPNLWYPNQNSQLKVDIYVTEGAAGNFEYSSNEIVPYLFQDSSNTYENAFTKCSLIIVQNGITNSVGGKNMPTPEDVRQKTIDKKSAREAIITKPDLESKTAGMGIQLIRQRNDIYYRRFLTYDLLKINSTNVIPSRTGELFIPESETESSEDKLSAIVPLNNVYQFWLSDDLISYNTNRYICKQTNDDIRTSAIARTNYYRMEVNNAHNVRIENNLSDKTIIISDPGYIIDEEAVVQDRIYSFNKSSTFCVFKDNLNPRVNGRTLYFINNTINDISIKISENTIVVPKYNASTNKYKRCKLVWSYSDTKWNYLIEEISQDEVPDEYGLLPTITKISVPKGEVENSTFAFKNYSSNEIKFTIYKNESTSYEYLLIPNYILKLTWNGLVWSTSDGGVIGDNNTPTNCVLHFDDPNKRDILYTLYQKYKGILMMCPFMIKIFKDPYFAALFNIRINDNIPTSFVWNDNDCPEKFAINQVFIERTDIRSNKYYIYCNVSVSENIYTLNSDTLPLKIKLELFKNDSTYCYFELNNYQISEDDPTKIKFYTYLYTDNELKKDDAINIINGEYTGDPEAGTVVPSINTYIPTNYYIPFKTKIRAHVVYKPDIELPTSTAYTYILTKEELENGYRVTDSFDTVDNVYFVRDVSNLFSTTLEVVEENGILPKYPSNIPAVYDKTIYAYNEDGTIKKDGEGNYIVIHNIGDPVVDEHGNPVYSHKVGEDILQYDEQGSLIYEVNPSKVFLIKNIPLVSILSILDETTKDQMYSLLTNTISSLQDQILPILIEGYQIVISLYNTIGPSETYLQGYQNSFDNLDKLDISITLNIKFDDLITDPENIIPLIKNSIQSYIYNNINNGAFYTSEFLEYLKSSYSNIKYIEFQSINDKETYIQTIKKSNSDDVVDNIPEYITVSQTFDRDIFKSSGSIVKYPNIIINTIL